MKNGFILKTSSLIILFLGLGFSIPGCGKISETSSNVPAKTEPAPKETPSPKKQAETEEKEKAKVDYVITGTLPSGFPDRDKAEGLIFLAKRKIDPPLVSEKVKTDAEGNFKLTIPGDKFDGKTLKGKLAFKSKDYAPLEAYIWVKPGKPVKAKFRPLILKADAVHYYGECLDEVNEKPIPYIGIYSDCVGTEIGRSDGRGHFDFYVPAQGTAHVLPWYSSDKYVGHSRFYNHQPGESVELKLMVERGLEVRVKTVDEKGNPVPGVKISWMGAGGAHGTTDKDGNVLLSGRASRTRLGCIVRAQKKGYVLLKNPGELKATDYTDKPLELVMHKMGNSIPKK